MCGKPPEEGKENLVPSEKWQGGTVELSKMAVAWLRRESLKAVISCQMVTFSAGGEPFVPSCLLRHSQPVGSQHESVSVSSHSEGNS